MLLQLAAEVVLAEDAVAAHAKATAGVDDHVDVDVDDVVDVDVDADAARDAPGGTDTEFGVAVDDFFLPNGFFPVSSHRI